MKRVVVLILAVVLLSGCAALAGCATSARRLTQISLGMTKQEVTDKLDQPAVARGAIRNKFNQVVEVWEYKLAVPSQETVGTVIGKSMFTLVTLGLGAAAFGGERKDYWLYFVQGELVRWGEAGDWSKEPDRIYEINFDTSPRIHRQ
ncbi:lipoprotein [Thermodesulfobacteriota bacterium]